MSLIELRVLSADQATADFGRLFRLWCTAFGLTPDDGAARGWRDYGWPTQRDLPGLRFVAAYRDEAPVGFAYGYRGARGQWWTDRIAEALDPGVAAAWIGGHFELSEIVVDPAFAGRGAGGSLHDAVLAGTGGRPALLCTALGDTPARRLFDRRGWVELGPLGAGFVVLGRPPTPLPQSIKEVRARDSDKSRRVLP